MALEPNSVQRDRMLSHGKTKLTLVQFLVGKDSDGFDKYFPATQSAVHQEGGKREFQLKIDQVLAGGDHPYQYLTIDSFPSSQALLMAHERTREIRASSLRDIYGLYLKPTTAKIKLVKGAGFLKPSLGKLLGTRQVGDIQYLADELEPATDPDLDVVQVFSDREPGQAFFMMNLNQFARQDDKRYLTGKAAYKRYSTWITPYLISVGGYPVIFDKPLGTYIGDQNSSLSSSWSEFGLVYYPSRESFIRLMTNTPRRAAVYRRAGLEKAVLMACVHARRADPQRS